MLLPNIPQFVLAFFGIVKMGGIVVAINPNYQVREIKNQLINAKVGGLFLLDSHLHFTSELSQSTPSLKFIHTGEDELVSLTDIDTQVIGNRPPVYDTSKPNCISLHNMLSLSGVKNAFLPDEVFPE